MFKIETHLHTVYCSCCGRLTAEEIVAGYLAAGYDGVIITDHYNRDTFRMLQRDLSEQSDHLGAYLEGYRRVKEAAQDKGLKVYRGAEIRFDGAINDYLLYGYSDDLLRDPEAVFTMGVEAFYPLCQADGALLIHAHPYRNGGSPTTARALDGVETLNCNPNHDNRNELARAFAAENGLLETAGSDCHVTSHIGHGGILTQQLPEDEAALVALLRRGAYKLFGK